MLRRRLRQADTPIAFLAVAEQALVSLTTFGLQLGLARLLSPAEFGSFAIGFTTTLLVAGIHGALVLEPFSVLAQGRFHLELSSYIALLKRWHRRLSLVIVPLSLLVLLRLDWHGVLPAVVAAGGVSPIVLGAWFQRRRAYVLAAPKLALWGACSLVLVQTVTLAVLVAGGILTSVSAMGSMALAWWSSGTVIDRLLKGSSPGGAVIDRSAVLVHHLRYGQWSMPTTLMHWLTTHGLIPLVSIFAGLHGAAAFRVLQTLTMPMSQVIASLSMLLTPKLSKVVRTAGFEVAKRESLLAATGFAVGAAAYCVLLIIGGGVLLEVLYSEQQYQQYSWLLPFMGAALIFEGFKQGQVMLFSAVERPKHTFTARVWGSLAVFTLGIPLMWALELPGVVFTFLVGVLAVSAASIIQWVRLDLRFHV